MTAVAALGMYDLPELREATDDWWQAIARALSAAGLEAVPRHLDRRRPLHDIWRDPSLLLTQTCGYPLTHDFADSLTAVAVPTYDAPGCTASSYRSAFVVREDDPARNLAAMRGRRAAANEPGSQSGCNALRAAVAALARDGRFFSMVLWSGAHRASLAAVRDDRADVAAVDAVTLALLQRYAPTETRGLRVLGWSAEAPALPYATRRGADPALQARLRAGLMQAATDPGAAGARRALLLRGLEPVADRAYRIIPGMRVEAERLGYPILA